MAAAASRSWARLLAGPGGQVIAVLLGLVPLALLVRDAFTGGLGVEPVEEITHRTGDWTLRLLLVTLAVTPLRRLTGRSGVIRFRRTLGLLAYGYAWLHFLTFFVLDHSLSFEGLGEDIAKRPYITVGFTTFLLLLPLAVTSTRGWVRRLGGKRWAALHRLIYVAGAGGVLHYLWLVKGEQLTPVWYALVLVALLALRVWDGRRRSPRERGTERAPPRESRAPPPVAHQPPAGASR